MSSQSPLRFRSAPNGPVLWLAVAGIALGSVSCTPTADAPATLESVFPTAASSESKVKCVTFFRVGPDDQFDRRDRILAANTSRSISYDGLEIRMGHDRTEGGGRAVTVSVFDLRGEDQRITSHLYQMNRGLPSNEFLSSGFTGLQYVFLDDGSELQFYCKRT